MKDAKYLKVTIHDNDFTSYYHVLGETLYNIFKGYGKYPDKEDLPKIKTYINYLWWTIDNLDGIYRWKNTSVDWKENPIKIFDVDLDIVEYTNIPDWDNAESIYIPLFDESNEILLI